MRPRTLCHARESGRLVNQGKGQFRFEPVTKFISAAPLKPTVIPAKEPVTKLPLPRRHPSESWDLLDAMRSMAKKIPAFAGMTVNLGSVTEKDFVAGPFAGLTPFVAPWPRGPSTR